MARVYIVKRKEREKEKEAVPVEARAHGPLVSPSTELGARRRDLLEKWWPSECETRST